MIMFFYLAMLLGAGCTAKIPAPLQRLSTARQLTAQYPGIRERKFDLGGFRIFALESVKEGCKGKHLPIYIEGDGLAWITSSRPSDNPTPINPLGLKLFLKDPAPCKIYLARPCQYIFSPACQQKYWTGHRYSKEVIDAYHGVLDRIKSENRRKNIHLFGYSGGGAVATILAGQRKDVITLVTVAGNLDTDFWTKLHGLTPLSGSLNPADFAKELEPIRQYHFIGGSDRNIPPSVFFSFQNPFADKKNIEYKIFDGFSHSCCWEREWPSILTILNNQRDRSNRKPEN